MDVQGIVFICPYRAFFTKETALKYNGNSMENIFQPNLIAIMIYAFLLTTSPFPEGDLFHSNIFSAISILL
jgi:hypothetical protein